jgi:hypothetical protein
VKQKRTRILNAKVIGENERWAQAVAKSDCTVDGVYAIATLGGHTRMYLILSADAVHKSNEEYITALEKGLHNVIMDVIEGRASKGRVKTANLRQVYREIYDEFCAAEWRMLRAGKWYDKNDIAIEKTAA